MLELFLGQIPEAIFFALFMIYAKGIKEKRFLFTFLMVVEYILMKQIIFLKFNIWFQILYTFMTFTILKILYKDKTQITDIFTFMIASISIMAFSLIGYLISYFTIKNIILASIIKTLCMIIFILVFKNKLYFIQNIYRKYWNRNDKVEKKIKSTTFRSIILVIFNLMFYILNLGIIYLLFIKGGV